MKIDSYRCLSGNVLKIIAAICMVIDHAGLLFFPKVHADQRYDGAMGRAEALPDRACACDGPKIQ